MSGQKHEEQLRDSIANVLELSRASWRIKQEDKEEQELEEQGEFPRSLLIKTLMEHPVASAATVASIWYFGPARFGAMAVAGVSLFMRHRMSILPLAEQLITSNLFKSRRKRSKQMRPAAETRE